MKLSTSASQNSVLGLTNLARTYAQTSRQYGINDTSDLVAISHNVHAPDVRVDQNNIVTFSTVTAYKLDEVFIFDPGVVEIHVVVRQEGAVKLASRLERPAKIAKWRIQTRVKKGATEDVADHRTAVGLGHNAQLLQHAAQLLEDFLLGLAEPLVPAESQLVSTDPTHDDIFVALVDRGALYFWNRYVDVSGEEDDCVCFGQGCHALNFGEETLFAQNPL